jgi:hypothetical protein
MPIAGYGNMQASVRTAALLLVVLPQCGCNSWAAIRVHDPNLVAVHLEERELAANSGVASVHVTRRRLLSDDQKVILDRRTDGRVVLDVPVARTSPVACDLGLIERDECSAPVPLRDYTGNPALGTEETLVSRDGNILATALVPGAESLFWRGDSLVVDHVYARYKFDPLLPLRSRKLTFPFEVWMTTRTSNVEMIETHKQPIRAFGWIALAVAISCAASTAALLTSRDPDVRAAGAYFLGVPALTFGTAGAAMLAWPDSVSREFPNEMPNQSSLTAPVSPKGTSSWE